MDSARLRAACECASFDKSSPELGWILPSRSDSSLTCQSHGKYFFLSGVHRGDFSLLRKKRAGKTGRLILWVDSDCESRLT